MSGVIVLHELGHTIAALFFGIPVIRFSIGFGPGLTIPGVPLINELHLGLILIGGYVLLPDLSGVPWLVNVIIGLSGILVNLLTAFICLRSINDPIASPPRMLFHWIFGVQVPDDDILPPGKRFAGPIALFKILALSRRSNAKLIAWLSLALANINLMPIIFLDGSRVADVVCRHFVPAEKVQLAMFTVIFLYFWFIFTFTSYFRDKVYPDKKI